MSLLLSLLLSCADKPGPAAVEDDTAEPAIADQLVALSAPRLLRRASLDLRGVLPTTDELDAVEADPTVYADLVATYLDDERFEARMVSLQSERWHTVMDVYQVWYSDYGIDPVEADNFAHSVGGEPLRLIARVMAEDAPWSEIVTADYTMSNELLASIWPIEYPDGATGWQKSTYTDGRPAAGVLSTNGLWWRYVTNISNKNRGRVAAMSRLLLCEDILSRPVVFTASSGADPEEAIKTDPVCVSCHSSIEPLAGNLFGFWWTIQYNTAEMSVYHPERELLAMEMLGVEPGWYGAPSSGLQDMGWFVANDLRFARCGVESNAELLWRRPVELADFQAIEDMREPFVAGGMLPKGLLATIVETPQYQAGGFSDLATDETRERELVERLLSPNQLKTAVADLTGLDWVYAGYDQLENDVVGYRTLLGGVDGYSVGRIQQQPGITWYLAMKRLAQAGAEALVQRDLISKEHVLIVGAELTTTSSDPAFITAIEDLHWRLYAESAEDQWVTDIVALYDEVLSGSNEIQAWEATLEVMFRDPRFTSY
jgi:hypothetical protein